MPGGHREAGETILETAKRELREETGAIDFTIKPICVYLVKGKTKINESISDISLCKRERIFVNMDGVLRNMASVFILKGDKILMLYRQGGKVVNNVWVASAGGHFEKDEINDARACAVRKMKEEKENIDTNFCSNEGRLEWVNKRSGLETGNAIYGKICYEALFGNRMLLRCFVCRSCKW